MTLRKMAGMRPKGGAGRGSVLHGAALALAVLLGATVAAATPVLAQAPVEADAPAGTQAEPPAEKETPYDKRLLRFAEVVGAVEYLRSLCKSPDAGSWRELLQAMIDADAGKEPLRKARLTAAFNRGYRSFAATHRNCTPGAARAEQRYRAEGATLATEITARFGN